MDEDRQADERKRRGLKDKREHKEKIAELKLEEKKARTAARAVY